MQQSGSAGAVGLAFFAAALLLTSACSVPGLPEVPDVPTDALPAPADSGLAPPPPLHDAGGPVVDAGRPPPEDTAHVPCDPSVQDARGDAGPEATWLELCVGLSTLEGTAFLDGVPTTAPIQLVLQGPDAESAARLTPDVAGAWSIEVLRGLYDQLLYRPTELASAATSHEGLLPLGPVDLRTDAVRHLTAESGYVEGVVTIDGAPLRGATALPNFTLTLPGTPTPQSARTFTTRGAYSMRFFESQSLMRLSISREELGDLELSNFRHGSLLVLGTQATQDFALHTAKFTSQVRFDGVPIPNRSQGDEYRIELTQAGETRSSVSLHHDVARSTHLSAAVPRGSYGAKLYLSPVVDPRYPSYLYDYPLSAALDLSADRAEDFNLTTVRAEGSLMLDGVPLEPQPTRRWQLYAYGYGNPDGSTFVSMFDVPFESAGFELRMLPSKDFYLLFYLSPALEGRLPTGWYVVDTAREILTDVALPINVETQDVRGSVSLPGLTPASVSGPLGRLFFSGEKGSFHLDVTDPSGAFEVRLPLATYRVFFDPDPSTFADLARGRYPLASQVVVGAATPVDLALRLESSLVVGPVRIDGELLPDTLLNGPEARLVLERTTDGYTFTAPLFGGHADFRTRAAPGRYAVSFELLDGALPGAASGRASLGLDVLVPNAPADAMDGGTAP